MGRKPEYIVEVPSGDVIWISYNEKNMLCAYNFLSYDLKKDFFFFHYGKRKEIDEILDYERKLVY